MNNPVCTAIASFGMSGQVFHGPLLKVHPGFRVKSVLELTKAMSAGLFPEARIVRNWSELLNDPEIELIIVNTPDHLHFDMTRQALEAGKHVVVEKPFAFKASEADILINLAGVRNLVLMVFQNRRWDGDFLTVSEIVESGILGRLVEFESHFDRYRPAITPDTWKEEGDQYAGVLYNLGSHMVDQALVLFGMPDAVTAHLNIFRPEGKVTDYYDIRMHYPGRSVLLRCSYLVKEEGPRYILHGTGGSFLKWGIDPQEEMLKKGILPVGEQWGEEPETSWGILNFQNEAGDFRLRKKTLPGNYPAFYDNLFEVIRCGKTPAVRPEEARDVIRILELCLDSHRQRKTVEVS